MTTKSEEKISLTKAEVCCSICKKLFKLPRSMSSHYTQIHLQDHPVVDFKVFKKKREKSGHPVGVPAWNKGLTKDDPRVAKGAETYKRRLAAGEIVPGGLGMKHSEETKLKISKRQSKHNKGGRSKWYEVSGVKVQGTWERNIALKLNELEVLWLRPKPLPYLRYDGKNSHYTPDFYLPEFNMYLEIKGYWWGRDKEKMQNIFEQYPNLRILVIEKELYEQILTI